MHDLDTLAAPLLRLTLLAAASWVLLRHAIPWLVCLWVGRADLRRSVDAHAALMRALGRRR